MQKRLIVIMTCMFWNTTWAGKTAEYCDKLLTTKEVERICTRTGVKVKDNNVTGLIIPCNLRYSSPKTNIPTREGYLFIKESLSFSSPSSASDMLDSGAPDNATKVSGIADGAWKSRYKLFKNHTDTLGFQKGKHFIEISSKNDFCTVDQLKNLATIMEKRMPKD